LGEIWPPIRLQGDFYKNLQHIRRIKLAFHRHMYWLFKYTVRAGHCIPNLVNCCTKGDHPTVKKNRHFLPNLATIQIQLAVASFI